jgi:glycosyl hydrolase family 16
MLTETRGTARSPWCSTLRTRCSRQPAGSGPAMETARLAAMSGRGVRRGYELEFEDTFDGKGLDERRWVAHYLPQWSTRELSAARYQLGDGDLTLLIDADQPPWCPDLDGEIRVSSLQTGVFAGPPGSGIGQHRFNPQAVVREAQPSLRLYTPCYGLFEIRAKALDDPQNMVAFWMIGYEDRPEHSAEICVCEIFGRDVGRHQAKVGMGVHPFGDPDIVDEFAAETVQIDAREFHVYTAEWSPGRIDFSVNDEHIKTVNQSPGYPMQLMVSIYEFPRVGGEAGAAPYPKRFVVDYVRGFRRS